MENIQAMGNLLKGIMQWHVMLDNIPNVPLFVMLNVLINFMSAFMYDVMSAEFEWMFLPFFNIDSSCFAAKVSHSD